MMNGISSATRSDSKSPDLDPDRPAPPATRVVVPPPPPPPPPPPDLPDVTAFVGNAVRAATGGLGATSPHPMRAMLAMGVKAQDIEYTVRTPMQANLDAFMERATPTFHTPDGDVAVSIPFRMVPTAEFMARQDPDSQPFIRKELLARAHAGEVESLARGLGMNALEIEELKCGRGTPENIQRVAQALIDQAHLPPAPPSDVGSRIRVMMCSYGLGLDCAGYVQQAFLASRAAPGSQAGLRPALNEDLTGLGSRGFNQVSLAQARPGDLFILKPPAGETVGHTMIIREARLASAEEAADLARGSEVWGHPDPSTIQRFELDSSWGSGGDPQSGGAMRRVFWHDTASGHWMREVGHVRVVQSTPYSHPIDGVYRPAREP